MFRFKNKLDTHKESVVAYHYILTIAKKKLIYNLGSKKCRLNTGVFAFLSQK